MTEEKPPKTAATEGPLIHTHCTACPLHKTGVHSGDSPACIDGNQRCCAFFENTGTATLLIAPDMSIAMVNAKVTEIYGYTRQELISSCFLDYLTPEYREMARLYHEMTLEGSIDPPRMLQCRLHDKEGNIREVVAEIGWIGPSALAIISLIDFTSARQAERERHNLSEIVEQSSESIMLTDVRGNIVYVNKAFEMLSGYLREEVVGSNVEHPFFSKQDRLTFKKMGFSAACKDVSEHRSDNLHKQGHALSIKTRVAAICNAKGRVTNLVCTKRDVTRESQFEQQLYQAQKMEAIGTLSSGIAHDFNNILGGIMGYAEMAIQPAADPTKIRRYMTRILQACERARDLTGQILAFSRHKDHEYQPVHIQPLINEALKLLRASTPTTIAFRKNLAAADAVVMADPTRIHQIIMNLCTNAAQAMESDGGTLEVKLQITAPPQGIMTGNNEEPVKAFALLSVTDTGGGIDSRSLAHIFEPYFTTKAAKGGTGLGLSVVQSIVKSMGGSITVDSEPGEGSTFEIYLPLIEHAAPKEKKLDLLLPRGRERLLIIDDEAFMREVLHDMLSTLGYQVETAEGPQFVIDRLRKNPTRYDLVIADLTMPHMNGRQLSARIRDISVSLPIILCTGMSYSLEQFNAEIPNIKALLPKPIQYEQLARTVRVVLDRKK